MGEGEYSSITIYVRNVALIYFLYSFCNNAHFQVTLKLRTVYLVLVHRELWFILNGNQVKIEHYTINIIYFQVYTDCI